jgi:hypothetical protein
LVSRVHTRPKAKLGLVGNSQRLGFIFKGGDADNRAKDLSWKLRISLRP